MPAPLTSIVILTRNQLDVTRACVASILEHTPEPTELVFVDNGSSDGTLDYLRSIDGAVVIDNDRNHGFGGGCNQGIAVASGERVLLLNNDVVVTPGWLGALHRALDETPDAGIAGPRSNRVAGVQQVEEVGYDTERLDGLERWAGAWVREHAGQRSPIARLVGFCMLVERAVIDRIGGFDLRYGLGNFEDDDFCLRAGVAGYGCVIAHDCFIHHVGSRTFTGEGIDYRATMAANLQRFAAAWQLGEDELDVRTGAYRPNLILARTTFDPARHHAPLLAVPDAGARIELDSARRHIVAVAGDRLDPHATRLLLDRTLRRWGPSDDVTVAVRIDPRDVHALALLEAAADEVGDAQLPDIAVVEAPEEQDVALLRASSVVMLAGRAAAARAALASRMGVDATIVDAAWPGGSRATAA